MVFRLKLLYFLPAEPIEFCFVKNWTQTFLMKDELSLRCVCAWFARSVMSGRGGRRSSWLSFYEDATTFTIIESAAAAAAAKAKAAAKAAAAAAATAQAPAAAAAAAEEGSHQYVKGTHKCKSTRAN
jgi:hypothetical protein